MQMLEAFRALNALNEDIFSLDADGVSKLSDFTQNDDLEDDVQIIDPEAETEDDLQDNYIGKVILDCCVCHSKLYKDKSEVIVDESGELANVGEECPYCFTPDGFKVIGEVVAFGEEPEEAEEDAKEETSTDDELEPEAENNELEESLKEAAFSGGVAGDNSYRGGTVRGRGASTQPNKQTYLNRLKDNNPDLVDIMTIKGKDIKPGMITQAGQVKEAEVRRNNRGETKVYIMHTNNYDGFWDVDEDMEVMADPENKSKPFAGNYRDLLKMGLQESFNRPLTEGDDSSFLNNYKDKIIEILKVIWPSDLTQSQKTGIVNKLNDLRGTPTGNALTSIVRTLIAGNKQDSTEQPNVQKSENGPAEKAPQQEGLDGNDDHIDPELITFAQNNKDKIAKVIAATNPDADKLSTTYQNELNKKRRELVNTDGGRALSNISVAAEAEAKANSLKKAAEEKSLSEGIEDLSMTANDTHVEISEEDSGKVTVTMEPATNEAGGEMIAPVSPEVEAEIMGDEPGDDFDLDDPNAEEATGDESEIDAEFDEFDEESMDGLGESYFKRVYENVNSFKTTAVKTSGNSMIIEGLLEFNSGNKKNTSFVFEALDATKSGKFRFIGDNKELTEGKKAFMLTGTINNNKLMVESMNYNYKHTDAEGKTSRVYGTERIK